MVTKYDCVLEASTRLMAKGDWGNPHVYFAQALDG